MNEVVKVSETELHVDAQKASSGNLLATVLQAAHDPNIDADKMKTLAELAISLRNDERETQFNRDLNAAKKEMPSIGRSGEIKNNSGKVQSRFSPWEKLNPIVSGVLHKHNLTIGHEIGSTLDGKISITPVLTHDNGMERRGKEMVFPPDTSGNKSAAQAVVSASSYGQRVTTIKILNIRTHDEPDTDGFHNSLSDPYEALAPHERALVDEGREKAADGVEAYAEYFKSLPTDKRGFLAYNKAGNGMSWHDQNKDLASKV